MQVIHMDNGTHSGRSRSWLLAALRSGSLSEVQSVIAYVAFQVRACRQNEGLMLLLTFWCAMVAAEPALVTHGRAAAH
eukprot:scaffold21959_cov21-Tisochrysis_lutea.AAC.6